MVFGGGCNVPLFNSILLIQFDLIGPFASLHSSRLIEGWDTLREMLKVTDFAEFEKDEAIIVKMVGESPTLAFMYVT